MNDLKFWWFVKQNWKWFVFAATNNSVSRNLFGISIASCLL